MRDSASVKRGKDHAVSLMFTGCEHSENLQGLCRGGEGEEGVLLLQIRTARHALQAVGATVLFGRILPPEL